MMCTAVSIQIHLLPKAIQLIGYHRIAGGQQTWKVQRSDCLFLLRIIFDCGQAITDAYIRLILRIISTISQRVAVYMTVPWVAMTELF